jgi:hypothetical protein
VIQPITATIAPSVPSAETRRCRKPFSHFPWRIRANVFDDADRDQRLGRNALRVRRGKAESSEINANYARYYAMKTVGKPYKSRSKFEWHVSLVSSAAPSSSNADMLRAHRFSRRLALQSRNGVFGEWRLFSREYRKEAILHW